MTESNPFVQQRLLVTGQAIVRRLDRAVIRVGGADRLSWLDGLLTQRVSDLQPGDSREGLVLSPQGRVEFQVGVVDDGEHVHLLTGISRAPDLLDFLDGMIFRENVTVVLVDDAVVIGCMSGPALETIVSGDGVSAVWHDPWPQIQPGGYRYAREEHLAEHWSYVEVVLHERDFPRLLARLAANDIAEVDRDALTPLRIAAWRPDVETEGDATLIPHEVDWLRSAVHLTKGCYRGQETVAKVHNLGAPPRRLVLLDLDGVDNSIPAPGAEVRDGDRVVGHVTVAARHCDDGPIALALVKRSCPETATLDVAFDQASMRATQMIIVPADAGHVADVPRLGSLTSRLGPAR